MRSPLKISYFSIFNTELLQIPIYLKYRDTKNRDATNTEIQQIQRYSKFKTKKRSNKNRDTEKRDTTVTVTTRNIWLQVFQVGGKSCDVKISKIITTNSTLEE